MTAAKLVRPSKTRESTAATTAAAHWTDDPAQVAAAEAALTGQLNDPFSFFGPQRAEPESLLRSLQPGAAWVHVHARDDGRLLSELEPWRDGLFSGLLADSTPYVLRIGWPDGSVQESEDPYAFGPILSDFDLHLFAEGSLWRLAETFGSRLDTIDGTAGVSFSVWAPNARRVSVVGDFNNWDGRRHPMRLRHAAGVWELFVPRLGARQPYKYEIVAADGTVLPQKADPLARASEVPPATASLTVAADAFAWSDSEWMAARHQSQSAHAPVSIYEVHAESWLHPQDGPLDWDRLARTLVPYVVDLGFTHIELLPIMGHPFSGSWGYQPLSLFAPMARLGDRSAFARFVNSCHRVGLGVILDWVPGHFPNDPHGLARFDGSALYEHEDPREGLHKDWNTCIYNYGRREVQSFLIASALHWLDTFHLDGLRVDAVASMLYRDYSREPGEWVPNAHGGRENLEAIAFLRRMNDVIAERVPGAITIAEESTAWPGVTAPSAGGGLGFSYKWNMGWMNDTLRYMAHQSVHRQYHHHDLTFGLIYAFSERFMLPLSHDEVVHGKGSLLTRMPGDSWQRFANLRAYLAFMWAHPGKKLLFMGGELAQEREWDHQSQLDWFLLDRPEHNGMQRLVRDLNQLYCDEPALHACDADPRGFNWTIGNDMANSVLAFTRHAPETPPMLCVFNLTPVPRANYRIGVPCGGFWRERLNSDSALYGGSNLGNDGGVMASFIGVHGHGHSVELTLPPLSALILHSED